MNVNFAVIADYANISREGKLNILGLFDIIYVHSLPAIHPQMQLVTRLEAPSTESGRTQPIEIYLMDADGKKLFGINGQIALTVKVPGSGENLRTEYILTLNNVKFEKAGDYVFVIIINNEEKGRVKLRINLLPQQIVPS